MFEGFYSKKLEQQEKACRRVQTWRGRAKLPVAIESTYDLVAARLSDIRGATSGYGTSSLYSLAIVRFINGFSDHEQKGVSARSVAALAAQLNIPGEESLCR